MPIPAESRAISIIFRFCGSPLRICSAGDRNPGGTPAADRSTWQKGAGYSHITVLKCDLIVPGFRGDFSIALVCFATPATRHQNG
jgi:hypothetical protein